MNGKLQKQTFNVTNYSMTPITSKTEETANLSKAGIELTTLYPISFKDDYTLICTEAHETDGRKVISNKGFPLGIVKFPV